MVAQSCEYLRPDKRKRPSCLAILMKIQNVLRVPRARVKCVSPRLTVQFPHRRKRVPSPPLVIALSARSKNACSKLSPQAQRGSQSASTAPLQYLEPVGVGDQGAWMDREGTHERVIEIHRVLRGALKIHPLHDKAGGFVMECRILPPIRIHAKSIRVVIIFIELRCNCSDNCHYSGIKSKDSQESSIISQRCRSPGSRPARARDCRCGRH